MSDKRRGLGRGLGALIPTGPSPATSRPVDVFFPGGGTATAVVDDVPSAFRAAPGPDEERADHGHRSSTHKTDERQSFDETANLMDRVSEGREVAPGDTGSEDLDAADVASREGASTDIGSDGTGSHDVGSSGVGSGVAQPVDAVPQDAQPGSTGPGQGQDVDGLRVVPGASYAELPVAEIAPNARQPRSVFDDDDMAELVGSISALGVLQPIVVRPIAPSSGHTDAQDGVRYELIMGERRWRATQQAGLTVIPAIIRETDDDDMLRQALLENLHRSQLNPLEEAAAYQQLLDDFGCTHDELATRLSRSRPQISNTLRLLRLPPLVGRRVAAGVLSAGHARALLGLSDAAAMERLAQRIVAEGLSVRSVEEIVALGEDERPGRTRATRRGATAVGFEDVAASLADRLDTRVQITMGARKGKMTVEFATPEDLQRILGLLGQQ